MQSATEYESPLGTLLLTADDDGLTGLWIEGQKYFGAHPDKERKRQRTEILEQAEAWLDDYFAGNAPKLDIPLHFAGTPFQKEVWQVLCDIPYGQTTTYGDIAKDIAGKRGIERMSARAVGSAVGHNRISIIVPCHRVVGSDGSLTGYAGGLERKIALLKLEGVDIPIKH